MTEQQKVREFINGLRDYIKNESHGKFNGEPLAENWDKLDEGQKDTLIATAFTIHAHRIATAAYVAIHSLD